MAMKYVDIRRNPTRFLALTSVSIALFDEILPFFTDAHDEYFRWHNVKGKTHDKKIADMQYDFPYSCTLWQDTGYQGFAPEKAKVMQSKKKPRNRELTAEEKTVNREISSKRITVEHAIGGAKILRTLKDECRLRKNNFVREIFSTAAGLHNWRMSARL